MRYTLINIITRDSNVSERVPFFYSQFNNTLKNKYIQNIKKMCEVQELADGLYQMFNKYKEFRKIEMLQILKRVRCCDCGHQKRLRKAQKIESGCPKPKNQGRISFLLVACFGFLILISIYMIYVARRYNHVRAYGSNACGSTFFYTYTDCDVFY